MSSAINLKTQILNALADGQFHSGEALGQQFGVSRAAVSNHVKGLMALGLEIFSVTGKGYKLARPLALLSQQAMLQHQPGLSGEHIEVLNIIGSTNDYLKSKLASSPSGFCVLAESQTAGRGRHGRKWVSPFGASLYMSMSWRFEQGYQAINGLSLAVGVAIADALAHLNIADVQLKWPNDVYANGKKLAGVLIEVEGQMGSACDCVIGIGLNVALPADQVEIDQPWTDLASLGEQLPDRNQVAAGVITSLHTQLKAFEQSGLSEFVERWHTRDLYRNKPVTLIAGQSETVGVCRGINASGAILLETDKGVEAFYGGEISVRPR